jgi:hypothetical protein
MGATLPVSKSKFIAYSQAFSAERREWRSRPSRRPLWETQGSIHTSQTPIFRSGSYALHVGVRIHRVFPRFSALDGESGALDPPDANPGRRNFHISCQTPTFRSGSYALHVGVESHRVFPGFSALNGESGAPDPPDANSGRRRIPIHMSQLRLIGAGATLSIPTSKFTAYSQAVQALNGESGAAHGALPPRSRNPGGLGRPGRPCRPGLLRGLP